jgi:predicted NBD/HSP70 family sugar kinase
MLTEDLGASVVSAGVSVPGVVRRADGLVREAPHLRWVDVPLGERLAGLLGVPVLVGNDGELGALAEHARGVARGASDIVSIAGAVGVGGGVISDGSALRGGRGFVGELGHMIVRPDGQSCHCGCRGCWETEIGEVALRRALGLPADGSRGEVIAELRGLAADPAGAMARLGGYCDWLALGLVSVVNVLAPELVVLGGLLAALPEPARQAVAAYLQSHSLVSRAVGGTRVVSSALGRDAQLMGAAELAFEPVLDAV